MKHFTKSQADRIISIMKKWYLSFDAKTDKMNEILAETGIEPMPYI